MENRTAGCGLVDFGVALSYPKDSALSIDKKGLMIKN